MPSLDPSDLPEFTRRCNEALRIAPEGRFDRFIEATGVEHFRVARDPAGALVAGGGFIPSRQRFGGAWLRSGLVTAVWASPAARGRGVATAMLRDMHRELRDAGFPVSSLFPANYALYRGLGYEAAAVKQRATTRLDLLPARAPEGWTVRELADVTPEAPGALATLYAAALPHLGNCATERVRPLWHALLHWNDGVTVALAAVDPAGEDRGSIVLDVNHAEDAITAHELVALEAGAGRTLLAALAGYRSIFETVSWPGGPFDVVDPLLRVAPDPVAVEPLMLRVLDVRAALAGRRYAPGLAATVRLEIADDLFDENARRIVLALDGTGAAEVSEGGDGAVRIDVRALAPLFTGHATARELAVTGGLTGPETALDTLTAAFAGPRPWLSDRF